MTTSLEQVQSELQKTNKPSNTRLLGEPDLDKIMGMYRRFKTLEHSRLAHLAMRKITEEIPVLINYIKRLKTKNIATNTPEAVDSNTNREK